MASRWQPVSDLTGPQFEPQTSRSRDERVTARATGRFADYIFINIHRLPVCLRSQAMMKFAFEITLLATTIMTQHGTIG